MKLINSLKNSKLGKMLVVSLIGVIAIGGMSFATLPNGDTPIDRVQINNTPYGVQFYNIYDGDALLPYADAELTYNEYWENSNNLQYDCIIEYDLIMEFNDLYSNFDGHVEIYGGFRTPGNDNYSVSSMHSVGKALDIAGFNTWGSLDHSSLLTTLGIPAGTEYTSKVRTNYFYQGYDVNSWSSGSNTAHVELWD